MTLPHNPGTSSDQGDEANQGDKPHLSSGMEAEPSMTDFPSSGERYDYNEKVIRSSGGLGIDEENGRSQDLKASVTWSLSDEPTGSQRSERPRPRRPKSQKTLFRRSSSSEPGDDDFDEKNAPISYVFNEWAQGTSIHGVPFVADLITWRLWKRLVWLGLVFVSCSLMMWQITTLIKQYNDYEVLVDVESYHPLALEFPEVTVCNINGFSRSRMEQTGIRDPKNETELIAISTPLEKFILATTFNGIPVNTSEVWKPRIMNNQVGRCWYFNTNKMVRKAGFDRGLEFLADLNQDDYLPETPMAGLMVFAEQRGSYVDNQLPFYTVKPGKIAMVNIQRKEIIRERKAPWTQCFSQAPEYTQSRCRSECIFEQYRQQCGCRAVGDPSKNIGNLPFCGHFNQKDNLCIKKITEAEDVILDECFCDLPPCNITKYDAGVIDEFDRPEAYFESSEFYAHNETKQYVLDNYVETTVNYEEIENQLLVERKSMTASQLLGNIGGSMGFFLGISMISVFEFIADLGLLRLAPRLFGNRHLYGVGHRSKKE